MEKIFLSSLFSLTTLLILGGCSIRNSDCKDSCSYRNAGLCMDSYELKKWWMRIRI